MIMYQLINDLMWCAGEISGSVRECNWSITYQSYDWFTFEFLNIKAVIGFYYDYSYKLQFLENKPDFGKGKKNVSWTRTIPAVTWGTVNSTKYHKKED